MGLAQGRKRLYIVETLEETVDLDGFEDTTATLEKILDSGLPTVKRKITKLLLKNYLEDELKGKIDKG